MTTPPPTLTGPQKRALHHCPTCAHLLASHDGHGCTTCANHDEDCDTDTQRVLTTYEAVAALLAGAVDA